VAFTSSLARDHSQRRIHARRQYGIHRDRLQSTLGDLIVALTEETRSYVRDEQEVYRVVAHIVNGLLSRRRCLSRTWH